MNLEDLREYASIVAKEALEARKIPMVLITGEETRNLAEFWYDRCYKGEEILSYVRTHKGQWSNMFLLVLRNRYNELLRKENVR